MVKIKFNIPIHDFLFFDFKKNEKNEIKNDFDNCKNYLSKSLKIEEETKYKKIKMLFNNFRLSDNNEIGSEIVEGVIILEHLYRKEINYQFKYFNIKNQFNFSFGFNDIEDKNEIEEIFYRILMMFEKVQKKF